MKQQPYKTAVDLIREDLERLQWTQRDLARAMGIDEPTTSRMVTGRHAITPDRAIALGKATGRNPWEYFEAQCRVWFENRVKAQALARVNGTKEQPKKEAKRRKQ